VSNAQPTPAPRPWPWWHLLGLWAVVVAQPLLDVLRQNGDFFVAHRASPSDLVLFAVVLLAAVPAAIGLAVRALGAVWVPLARTAHVLVVGLLVAAMASQVVQRLVTLPTWPHVGVAVAIGSAGAWIYARSTGIRWCASALLLAVPVFGAMFLMDPAMQAFVDPLDRTTRLAAKVPAGAPPIVMVVFDQLPVSSLLAPNGAIDATHFPGFASLAAGATWFSNATANGEYTGWALPAIMTGRLPRPSRLPISQHHPQNLFSVIGEAYRFEVREPITQLCPERLCPADDEPAAAQMISMLLDSSVVYAHIVSPRELRAELPALTDDWRDFARADQWQGRWVRARDRDRTEPVEHFIDSIQASDPQPTMYFLHVLLPHEPYVYLRSGQRFSTEARNAGMTGERWGGNPYLVSLGYARHLAQLGYVDAVIERLLARLRTEGLYDRAIVIVTSDHGASFRPGHPWKGLDETNRPDIMGVPLFIKAPGQSEGRVDARNMEAIDVLPTVAGLLRVSLREAVDGHSALGDPVGGTRKTMRHGGATRETVVETAEHARTLLEAVARRWTTMFDGVRAVPPGAPREMLDTPAPASAPVSPLSALIEQPQRFRDVDLRADILPLHIEGRVFDADGRPTSARLAVAVNGVVRSLAQSVGRGQGAPEGAWTALLPASSLRAGRNLVQVYTLGDDGRAELAFSSGERPESLNLSSNAAVQFWGVTVAGLLPRERRTVPAFRWTSGEASLVLPLDVEPRPRSIRIGFGGPPPAGGSVRIRLDDCALFDGAIDAAPWHRTFSLDACPATRSAHEARLAIESATVKGEDGHERGIGLETVNLFSAPWPPPPAAPGDLQGSLAIVGAPSVTARSTPATVDVRNTGRGIWSDVAQGAPARASVSLALSWRRLPGGPVDTTQQLRLPHVLYPGDLARLQVPLVPPPSVDGPGPWEVTLSLAAVGGSAVAVARSPVLSVTLAAPR
jgi:hypothetical protein